jgi:hypothetical protein
MKKQSTAFRKMPPGYAGVAKITHSPFVAISHKKDCRTVLRIGHVHQDLLI